LSCGIEHPRTSQHGGAFAHGYSPKQRYVNSPSEQFGEVHLQAAEGEEAGRVEWIGFDKEVDIALGSEAIRQDGAEQVHAAHPDSACSSRDPGEIKVDVV
jgi:hypothetical protein